VCTAVALTLERRLPRLSTTLRRTLDALGVRSGTALHRAVNATIRTLKSDTLPGAGDYETAFARGRPHGTESASGPDRRLTGKIAVHR